MACQGDPPSSQSPEETRSEIVKEGSPIAEESIERYQRSIAHKLGHTPEDLIATPEDQGYEIVSDSPRARSQQSRTTSVPPLRQIETIENFPIKSVMEGKTLQEAPSDFNLQRLSTANSRTLTGNPIALQDAPQPMPTFAQVDQAALAESSGTRSTQPILPNQNLAQLHPSTFNAGTARAATTTNEPRLMVHPEYLVFSKTSKGFLLTSQPLEIRSKTGENIHFSISESLPWLSVNSSGNTVGETPVSVDVRLWDIGLAAQESPYTGKIEVVDTANPENKEMALLLTSLPLNQC